MPEMTDEELIGYAEIHSDTPRALFHRRHIERLAKLAGTEVKGALPEFVAWHYIDAKPYLDAARKNLKEKANDSSVHVR